jgi:hypothetical protein
MENTPTPEPTATPTATLTPTPTPTPTPPPEWELFFSDGGIVGHPLFCAVYGTVMTYTVEVEQCGCNCAYSGISWHLDHTYVTTEPVNAAWVYARASYQRIENGGWCASLLETCDTTIQIVSRGEVDMGFGGVNPCAPINQRREIVVELADPETLRDEVGMRFGGLLGRPDWPGPYAFFELEHVEIGVLGQPTPTPWAEPTPTLTPTEEGFPSICATPALSVPLAVDFPAAGEIEIIEGECVTIVPHFEYTLDLVVIDPIDLVVPGFEVCYDLLILPDIEILGWPVNLALLMSVIAGAYLLRLVNQQFGA